MVRAPGNQIGPSPGYGALVISLDLELHWGVRDWSSSTGLYRRNLLGDRPASEALIECFEQRQIAATWAGVGMLFARSRDELERFRPQVLPTYEDSKLSPYDEPVGASEHDDPLHLAGSLIAKIRSCPNQEVATHTFAHYYCMEPGQTAEQFRADLASAVAIADAHDVRLKSIVFPRNQVNPAYLGYLAEFGITTYRGAQPGPLYRTGPWDQDRRKVVSRGLRLIDAYAPVGRRGAVEWSEVPDGRGCFNVAASRFLRPYSPRLRAADGLRLKRILDELDRAAEKHQIFHLWWHPHNFGTHLDENMAFLSQILDRFEINRRDHGMRSMTMADVGSAARAMATSAP